MGTAKLRQLSMSRGLSESRVVRKLANDVCTRVTRRVIRALQQQSDSILSGDDSGLANTWEEVCVQIQHEHSFNWSTYEDLVTQLVGNEARHLLAHEREAVWLQTPAGCDWHCGDEEDREPEPVRDDDIVDYIASEYIYAEADRWSNRRIRRYLANQASR